MEDVTYQQFERGDRVWWPQRRLRGVIVKVMPHGKVKVSVGLAYPTPCGRVAKVETILDATAWDLWLVGEAMNGRELNDAT